MIISTPAKIILSGEHSVVYGAPAIGAPLALFLYSRWSQTPDSGVIVLEVNGRRTEIAASWQELPAKMDAYRARYDKFRAAALPIREVLPDVHDLVTLVLAAFYERYRPQLGGLSLSLETQIPISSGLGSSSSLILNLLQGLLRLSGQEMPQAELLECARTIEDFQHGYSSGLDLALVASRQPLVFVRGQGVVKAMPPLPSGLVLVHSGTPSVSTGECVAAVRARFGDSDIWQDFTACTGRIEEALTTANDRLLKDSVAENQQLLTAIGVVPQKVQTFISACLERGIPAKICGAGAVSGEAAGMIWALADNDATMRALEGLATQYGYRHGLYSAAG